MIALPSQSGLNPNMAPLLGYPARALAKGHAPAGLAIVCEGIASGLLLASTTAPEGDVVGAEDLADAARWFAMVSTRLRGAVQ